ncbi:hypothetical protein QJS10_CPA05g01069 [Acorus calamus]|uniref:Uncharacterized protein n=1 Tax=Acorus calamus TaxID=4465 RepID=A0AAV9EU22_ACOCL|nr:hypothetical protein QJS10_CPA05g01069 [Acorus calamus]
MAPKQKVHNKQNTRYYMRSDIVRSAAPCGIDHGPSITGIETLHSNNQYMHNIDA